MDKAAKSMQDARAEQVKEWKQELTSELDQSVQEMMQLAREERALEQKVRAGASNEDRRERAERGGAGRGQGERAAAGRGQEERAAVVTLHARGGRCEGEGVAGDGERDAERGERQAGERTRARRPMR